MADETNTTAPAAAPIPATAPSNPTIQRPASQSVPGGVQGAKPVARSPLITNPTPARDLDAPEPIEDNTPNELPQSTIAEMEAGRKALERNKPVNHRAAANRTDAENSSRKDV